MTFWNSVWHQKWIASSVNNIKENYFRSAFEAQKKRITVYVPKETILKPFETV
jgi:hypothetical protein